MTPRYEPGAHVSLKEHKVLLEDILSVFFSSANSILQSMKKLPSVLQYLDYKATQPDHQPQDPLSRQHCAEEYNHSITFSFLNEETEK